MVTDQLTTVRNTDCTLLSDSEFDARPRSPRNRKTLSSTKFRILAVCSVPCTNEPGH